MSMMVNQTGEGSMKTIMTPPIRKMHPMTKANLTLCLSAINAATSAPTKVPKACAKKGIKKCLGSKRCKASCRPSVVFVTAPSGGGMIDPLMLIRNIFNEPPTYRPTPKATIPKMAFFKRTFMHTSYN